MSESVIDLEEEGLLGDENDEEEKRNDKHNEELKERQPLQPEDGKVQNKILEREEQMVG